MRRGRQQRSRLVVRPLVLALALALAFGGVAAGGTDGLQSVEGGITPTKLDKRKFEPATLFVDVFTALNDEGRPKGEQPPSVNRIRVDLPRNLRFDPAAVPRCGVGAADLDGRTAAEQQDLCGRDSKVSIDGGSSAQVTYDPTPLFPAGDSMVVPVSLQVFNGREPNSLYLATDPEGMFVTTPVIVGELVKSDAERAFGSQLDLVVPALRSGAFSNLKVTLSAKTYIQARCRRETNTLQVRAEYEDHSPSLVQDETRCKQRKPKRRG